MKNFKYILNGGTACGAKSETISGRLERIRSSSETDFGFTGRKAKNSVSGSKNHSASALCETVAHKTNKSVIKTVTLKTRGETTMRPYAKIEFRLWKLAIQLFTRTRLVEVYWANLTAISCSFRGIA